MNENQFLVLKGRNIIAQGKRRRSVALGWRVGKKIVRVIMFIKEKFIFRTKETTLCFMEMMSCNSVRKGLLALFIESSRTVFLLHPLPRLRREFSRTATFRIVPPETLPWAELSWPFSPIFVYKE